MRRKLRANSKGRAFLLACALGALVVSHGAVALADARTDYLVKLLETSQTFRVRAQAAVALGRATPDGNVVRALGNALRDENASVRAAAASSLGHVGDASSIAALRACERDSDPLVQSACRQSAESLERTVRTTAPATIEPPPPSVPPRYYVGVGATGSAIKLDARSLARTREFIVGRVAEIDGVLIAPERETPAQVRSVLKQKHLTGYYLDVSIVRVENVPSGTKAVVSVIVGTYPGRDMRVILQGAATVQGAVGGDAARSQAIEGAISGALRRLPQALVSSAGSDG
ncbi:MAG: HEAT repeat domain-containing protein [Polyangiales bacterium]|nr:HEAT repeat domain-containing protein [Myxococcales bacterium]